MKLLNSALSPSATNVQVSWSIPGDKEKAVYLIQPKKRVLFADDHLSAFIMTKKREFS